MKVIVTGGQGQLGLALRDANRPASMDLQALGREHLDIRNPASIESALAGADVCINTAAYTDVDGAESASEEAFRVNAQGASNVAARCRQLGVRLIHVSTDYVFDGNASSPYQPGAAINPINVYGASKAAGEAAIREHLTEHVIVRTSWVFGEYGRNFVKTMLRLGLTRPELNVVADQVGGPTSTHDLAAALVRVAELVGATAESRCFGTFHFSGVPHVSWAELASATLEIASREGRDVATVNRIPSADFPQRAARPASSMLDCASFTQAFSMPAPSWQNALERLIPRLLDTPAFSKEALSS